MSMTVSVYLVAPTELADVRARPMERLSGKVDCELDKAWAAIHHVLTGQNMEPGGPPHHDFLLFAGEELDEDTGYGPPRLVSVAQTASIAHALAPMGPEAFRARFDHAALLAADVYAVGTNAAEELEYVAEAWASLHQALAQAARTGSGLLIAMV
jgi:hypothetical protein